ncbi:hypothetical protein OC846_005232 [Tilletia horrida]|uniref:Uncharacterized protein n=1 Tax=Tilletia horrida TaxID=155126 RepID=A0AAN6GLR1_9BASI|nr:hypothetical protein OC846_005232 [Tilletia horrida]
MKYVLHSADRSVSKAETGTKQPLDEQMPMAKRFVSNREIAYAVILGLQFGLGALSFGLGYKAALIQHKIVPDPGYRKPNKEPKSRMYEE